MNYEDVMLELESVSVEEESRYMNAVYDTLHQMHQFTTQELAHNVEGDDILKPELDEEPQHYEAIGDMILYEIFMEEFEKSNSLKEFVKNVKRMKEFEDGRNLEFRNKLANEALDEAQEAKEKYNVRPDETAEGILDAADKATNNMINDYEKVVESVIWPAIRNLD